MLVITTSEAGPSCGWPGQVATPVAYPLKARLDCTKSSREVNKEQDSCSASLLLQVCDRLIGQENDGAPQPQPLKGLGDM